MSNNREGGAEWERGEAWKLIRSAMDAGDQSALELGWSRYSDAMVTAALSVTGKVIVPLDNKITDLVALFQNARTADLNWRTEERLLRDQQSDRLYTELNILSAAMGELARGLGGLREKVEDHEVRIVAIETHGAPAKAVDELHQLRADVEVIRNMLILTRRQLWLTFAAVSAIALIFLLAILAGGGR